MPTYTHIIHFLADYFVRNYTLSGSPLPQLQLTEGNTCVLKSKIPNILWEAYLYSISTMPPQNSDTIAQKGLKTEYINFLKEIKIKFRIIRGDFRTNDWTKYLSYSPAGFFGEADYDFLMKIQNIITQTEEDIIKVDEKNTIVSTTFGDHYTDVKDELTKLLTNIGYDQAFIDWTTSTGCNDTPCAFKIIFLWEKGNLDKEKINTIINNTILI